MEATINKNVNDKYNAYMRKYFKYRYENDGVYRHKMLDRNNINYAINMLNDDWRINRNAQQRIIDSKLKDKKHNYYLYRKALKAEQLTSSSEII
jgi:hypothetical protein